MFIRICDKSWVHKQEGIIIINILYPQSQYFVGKKSNPLYADYFLHDT